MKRFLSIAAVLCVMGVTTASAAVTPYIAFWADGGARDLIEIPFYQDDLGRYRVDSYSYSTSEYSLHLNNVLLDPDPSIAYGIAVTDFGAPSTFSFLFMTPIVPIGTPNVVTGSISGGLTDFGGDGVSIAPLSGSFVQKASVGPVATSMGVDVGPATSFGPGVPGSLYTYGAFAAGPLAGPGPGPWTTLTLSSEFTLSGGSDIASLTGYSSIEEAVDPVPEPASLLLLGGGLLGVAAARRRRVVS